MRWLKRLFFFLISLTTIAPAMAQELGDTASAWANLMELYGIEAINDEEEQWVERMEQWEEMHRSPININLATRNDLLALPFVGEQEADSILSYRTRKGGFLGLGELMLVPRLPRITVETLPLFLYCAPAETVSQRKKSPFTGGRYELHTQLDVPLYVRDGNRNHSAEELATYPNRQYLGNGLRHIVRFRYENRPFLRYGLTLEKDAGEPFANRNNYPYDYTSAYMVWHSPKQRHEFIVGDYEVSLGQGLVCGTTSFSGRVALAEMGYSAGKTNLLRPHTSANEVHFFRGAAAKLSLRALQLIVFASYRSLDASHSGDTIRTLQTTGLHRTQGELDQRRFVGRIDGGAHLGWQKDQFTLGAGLVATHYAKYVSPAWRKYNEHYFRGQDALAFSIDGNWHSRRWTVRGEVAADKNLHLAAIVTSHYRASDDLKLTLQARHYSPRFVSIHGNADGQQSHVMNEQGLMLAATMQLSKKAHLTAYIDAYRFPHAVYRNSTSTLGLEAYASLQLGRRYGKSQWFLTYKLRTRQQNFVGDNTRQQYVQTHRATLRLQHSTRRWQFSPTLAATYYRPQQGDDHLGLLAALRVRFEPHRRLRIAGFAGAFTADDYLAALYVYQPQLPRNMSIPSFYGKGMNFVVLPSYELVRKVRIALRYSFVHYFDRHEISSGTQRIQSSSKNDLSLQLIWQW